jgi:hypothetical protein
VSRPGSTPAALPRTTPFHRDLRRRIEQDPLTIAPGDPLQKRGGRLVGGVLGHELALERPLEDRLSEPLGTLQVRGDDGFEIVDQLISDNYFSRPAIIRIPGP